MSRPPRTWPDDLPDNSPLEDEEIIRVSKSEIKRDAEELKHLGAEMAELSQHELAKLPLDQTLRDAITLAQRLAKEGRRRQVQLIGKLLRQRDVAPIRQALNKLKNRDSQQVALLKKLEALRDRLVAEGDDVLTEVISRYPSASRQQLRVLIRNAQKEMACGKPAKAYRQIFHYLRELAEN